MIRKALVAVTAAGLLAACAGALGRGEGLDQEKLPTEVRPEYALFAQRCSKCHSLARPLQSGIDDDDFWRRYVARMRQQPGSGISEEDGTVILRFLHYYSVELKKKKAEREKT